MQKVENVNEMLKIFKDLLFYFVLLKYFNNDIHVWTLFTSCIDSSMVNLCIFLNLNFVVNFIEKGRMSLFAIIYNL